jgi:multidrug resistance efflux pump
MREPVGLPRASSASSATAAPLPGWPRQPDIGPATGRGDADPASPAAEALTARRSSRWVYLLGVMVFFAYALWMIGPYLHSVIVRDAAVTTWSHLATAPIDGKVEFRSRAADRIVDAQGSIVLVRNDTLSREAVTAAQTRVDLARARVTELHELLAAIKTLDAERGDLKARYADIFRAQLDAEIASLERQIGVTRGQLGVMQKVAARSEELARRGTGAETTADEARMRVSDLELELAELQAKSEYARVRRLAADSSVFITVDGEDPEWVRGERLELKIEKNKARLELRQAQAELTLATAALAATAQDFDRLSQGAVSAPPGSIVWSERVAPGATVRAGNPVAEWLDCSILMVDVPVADAEVALIKPGMPAEVVLEGEPAMRTASVLLTRGSASTLGRDDLAALAKGRREGVGQVLLALADAPEDLQDCPVGRAAYVDFPQIGLIDVIRARLRL